MKWSYSSITMYDLCPRKYQEIRVLKKHPKQASEAMTYGTECHEAAENYIEQGWALPPKFEFIKPYLDPLKKIPGKKHCELRMGLKKDLTPCWFMDPEVWWQGVADLVVLNGDKAHLIDYKTGKSSRYADYDQLEILSLALFKHYPQIKTIKAALLFLVAQDFKEVIYSHEYAKNDAWVKWFKKIQRLETSIETGVWNPIPNFTCRNYCPCTSCPHHGG